MLTLTAAAWGTILLTIASLVVLEGLLSADNALVLAVMVRHLPKDKQKRALRYGIFGAFFFRAVAVLLAAQILDYWQFEVVGGLYLLYLAFSHLLSRDLHDPDEVVAEHLLGEHVEFGEIPERQVADGVSRPEPLAVQTPMAARSKTSKSPRHRGFWGTVIGVELADIAFSIDSILAAVAMADEMPEQIRTVNLGWFDLETAVVYIGGILGIITMRFVAGYFLVVLDRFPGLARGAYFLVGWIGLKLVGSGLAHAFYRDHKRIVGDWRERIPMPEGAEHVLEMPTWFFWTGMAAIVIFSMLLGPKQARSVTPGDGVPDHRQP